MMLKRQRIQKHSIPPHLPYPWIISRLRDGTGDFIFYSTTPPYASRRTSSPDLGDKKSLSPSKISTTVDDDDHHHHMDPNTMVFLFDKAHPSVIYCKLGEKLWNTVCYTEKIPARLHLRDIKDGFDEPFSLNGSLYARGGQYHKKLLCIHQVQPTHIDVRKYCDLPRIQGFTHTNHSNHLVESYGELFYIVISSEGEHSFTIVDMNVFKLNQESLRWQKVKRVQDRFSSSPKSPECLVVAIDSLHFPCVYTIHPGEEKWHYYEFENHNYRSDTSLDSPVFYDGAIYVLDEYGNLVVFELQREGKMTWKVLHVHKRPIEFDYQNFLLKLVAGILDSTFMVVCANIFTVVCANILSCLRQLVISKKVKPASWFPGHVVDSVATSGDPHVPKCSSNVEP
ncbi:hypothetical protein HS088_TW21G01697 [Tripterygium wilfordii]|uniref:KIB1-4 beta-propeller domain-containing protein n=1 Tax=Tripterygium wilfordii TaxID=458696 RepID=A0A7J7C5S6_TRIWF|nr:hypothetical protein HS088_TW21G01697 [Tripterygium wilfordii]